VDCVINANQDASVNHTGEPGSGNTPPLPRHNGRPSSTAATRHLKRQTSRLSKLRETKSIKTSTHEPATGYEMKATRRFNRVPTRFQYTP